MFGEARIYYSRPDVIRDLMMGIAHIRDHLPGVYDDLKAHKIDKTHVYVQAVMLSDLDEIYDLFQAEVWSPGGEACELIKSLGLDHTSMSIGDIIQIEDGYYFCDYDGWVTL